MTQAIENLRQPDGFLSMTDLFARRNECSKQIAKLEENLVHGKTNMMELGHWEYEFEEVDNIIKTTREVERGVEEYEVIVEETIAYTVNVKATSRESAESLVQNAIDHHQFFDTFACDGESQDLHIYSVEEVA